MMPASRLKVILFFLTVLFLSGCEGIKSSLEFKLRGPESYFIIGNKEEKKELSMLFKTLKEIGEDNERKYIILQQIIKHLHNPEHREKLNLFLTTYVEKNPSDPFDAYYLLVIAENYREEEAFPFAIHYFERIIKNYNDLLVRGRSVHFICLTNLITLVKEPEIRVNYYKELIARFSENSETGNIIEMIDKGPIYYYLGRTYEDLGEWDLSIQAYKNFLKYPDTRIPEKPDIHKEIESMVAFYDYRNKNWTVSSLEDLTKKIQSALYKRDSRQLNRYRSKVNFFAKSWEQEGSESNIEEFCSALGRFMLKGLRYNRTLDTDSNAQEAYLKTWGWSYRIKTWYLYFRKIDFPPDPELNGQWEWAGIYFGKKPFSGSKGEI